MKNREYLGKISSISEREYYQRISDISTACKQVHVFEFEGCFFSGTIVGTIKAYLDENPSKSFFVWLIDNGLEVKQS